MSASAPVLNTKRSSATTGETGPVWLITPGSQVRILPRPRPARNSYLRNPHSGSASHNRLISPLSAAPAATIPRMPVFQISEAAHLLGVSDDTVRRWADVGHLHTVQQPSGRLGVEGEELARFAVTRAEDTTSPPIVGESSRNRFTGIITRVIRDQVMAQVDLQAGPFRVVSLMSREAADELGLAPGVLAVAAVKSTNVVIELARQP